MNMSDLAKLGCDSLSVVFDTLPIGISILDKDFNVLYQNPIIQKWIPGLKNGEHLIFEKIAMAFNPPDLLLGPQLKILTHRVFNEKLDYENLLTFQQNHRWYQFKFCVKPMLDCNGEVCGLLEIVENTSHLYETNQALVQAKRFENVGRLASGIAHDFNNILQVIIGHCEILGPATQDNEKLRRSLDIILTSGKKASALTRQILMFSRKQETEFKIINPQNLLVSLEKILSRMVGEDIKINIDCHNKYCINADESQIEQVFLNLTVNARDAMPLGGNIEIRITDCLLNEMDCTQLDLVEPGKYICVRFGDTGKGIESENLDHIFDPFFSTKDKGKSFGLGLSTVFSIVRQHQGIITVQSEIDLGTVFEIYLPAHDTSTEVAEEEHIELQTSESRTETILVVEDDIMVCDLASQVLELNGYVVEAAHTMMEAIEKVQKTRYDLYLVDIVLPDGSGVDLIEYIEDLDPHAAFILSSGYTDDKPQIRHAIEAGYEFMHKPYAINTLLTTCRMMLDKKKNPNGS
ncbi:MAG: response regulator [Candidatus Cloacimonetes bacterium]|nr:response regulator [Candidatus Cloacimonadota bacterium]